MRACGAGAVKGLVPVMRAGLSEERGHRLDAILRVASVLQARQAECVLDGPQLGVVVVGGAVGQVPWTLVGDHDGHHVTATRIGAAATGAWLTLVGEVVLVPGDDD